MRLFIFLIIINFYVLCFSKQQPHHLNNKTFHVREYLSIQLKNQPEKNNANVTIHCIYKSQLEKQYLKINCYEYREMEQKRILSNDEIEKLYTPNSTYKLNKDYKAYTQTYKMDIE